MRKERLICQYLENVSRELLGRYQDIIKSYVFERHGIYALYDKHRKLYYVGLAKDLKKRLNKHLIDRHGSSWDYFNVYLTVDKKHLKDLESLFLRILKPKGNTEKGNFVFAENMIRKLKRDFRKARNDESKRLIGDTNKSNKAKINVLSTSGLFSKQTKIKCRFKGKTYHALLKINGQIRYKRKLYSSLSMAGKAVVKRACNGWDFWEYERAPGDWVKIDYLRKLNKRKHA